MVLPSWGVMAHGMETYLISTLRQWPGLLSHPLQTGTVWLHSDMLVCDCREEDVQQSGEVLAVRETFIWNAR